MLCPAAESGVAAAHPICRTCYMCVKDTAAAMSGCRCVPVLQCIGKQRVDAHTGWGHTHACQTMNKSCLATIARQQTAADTCLSSFRASTTIQLPQEEMGSPHPQGGGVSGVDAWCPQGAGAKAIGPHMTSVLAPPALGNLLSPRIPHGLQCCLDLLPIRLTRPPHRICNQG